MSGDTAADTWQKLQRNQDSGAWPPGQTRSPEVEWRVEFKLDRRAFTVTSFAEEAATNRPLIYWLARPPAERVSAVEFLRRHFIGPGARLQRVLRVVERTPR